MNAIQDIIQSAWMENERAIQKKKADEEKKRADEAKAKARRDAKAQADAAWARAHETRRPYPKIDLGWRILVAIGLIVPWIFCFAIPLLVITEHSKTDSYFGEV